MTSPSDTTNGLAGTPLTATLVASGLLDRLAVHRINAEVVAQRPTSPGDHDRRLAERLVESGVLNRWQVEQLRRGRTKFNLGPYRILDSIARGGMGHVFKAEHELLGRTEAVKVLPRLKSTPEAVSSFLHEIRAQAGLDHPNLVRVSYADRDGDTHYFVTEFVPGIDLRRLIRRGGALTEREAAWALSQAAEAIDHAHRRGLVHRDIKPGNLLLTPTGAVKVTDLGLSWSLEMLEQSGGVYAEGKIAGTSDYLAPEAVREPDRVRPESDLYSLGCTLYYAVTGKVPFPGGSHMDKLRRRVNEPPPDPKLLAPGLSAEMLQLIRALMASRPEDRPRSAGEVATSLAILAGAGAKGDLATRVTEVASRRSSPDDTTPSWSSGDAGELPETVGLPLHDLTPELTGPPAAAAAGSRLARWVTYASLVAAGAIGALAAGRALWG